MKKIKKTDSTLVSLIHRLRREKKPFWKRVADILARPRSRMIAINISRLNKLASDGSIVVVPGKVLGDGQINKKMTVAAFKFSESAERLITKSGGKTLSILDLVDSKKQPRDVLLLS